MTEQEYIKACENGVYGYGEYLKTPKWKMISERRKYIDNYTCQGCHITEKELYEKTHQRLQVHHLSYGNNRNGKPILYHEDESDNLYKWLVTLCPECHARIHQAMNRITDASGQRGWKNNHAIPQEVKAKYSK